MKTSFVLRLRRILVAVQTVLKVIDIPITVLHLLCSLHWLTVLSAALFVVALTIDISLRYLEARIERERSVR